jgi:hypothetical protein
MNPLLQLFEEDRPKKEVLPKDVVGLNAEITLAQSGKGGGLLNQVQIQVLQLKLVVVKDLADEFIHWHPKSMLVKSSKTNHIPRRADRFSLITGNNPLWPIRVNIGAEEALLHQLLGVLGDERGNWPWLHWRRLAGIFVAAAATKRKDKGNDCARRRGGFHIGKRTAQGT